MRMETKTFSSARLQKNLAWTQLARQSIYTFHYMEERDERDAAGCYTMCMPLWEDTIDEDDILLTWTIDSACNLPQCSSHMGDDRWDSIEKLAEVI